MMPSEKSADLVRRVVTGEGEGERSRIVSDGPVRAWAVRPGGSLVMDVWRIDTLPCRVDDPDVLTDVLVPPLSGGLVVRMCRIPPDSEVDAEAYTQAIAEAYGGQADVPASDVPGMHRTDTVDVVTVISGALTALLEDGETVLGPGDSLVQRGTMHAWRNRTSSDVLLTSVMVPAAR